MLTDHSQLYLFFLNHGKTILRLGLGFFFFCHLTCFLWRFNFRTGVLTFLFRVKWNNSELIVPSVVAIHLWPQWSKTVETLILPMVTDRSSAEVYYVCLFVCFKNFHFKKLEKIILLLFVRKTFYNKLRGSECDFYSN